MSEFVECSECTSHPDDPSRSHIFSQAIDIAVAARTANVAAENATQKAEHIEGLAKRARHEADKIQQIAASLASTAGSVAGMALEICQFQSYWDAFSSRPDYVKQMEYDEFLQVVTGKNKTTPRLKMESTGRPKTYESSESNSSQEWTTWSSGSSTITSNDSDEYSKKQPANAAQLRINSQKGATGRRGSLPAYFLQGGPGPLGETEDPTTKYTSEKFPVQPSPLEYKDSLANSFDSAGSMLPLWEDRYVSTSRQNARITPRTEVKQGIVHPPQNWSEKKLIKQLNIKLHKNEGKVMSEDNVSNVKGKSKDEKINKPRLSPIHRLKTEDECSDNEVDEILRTNEPIQMKKLRNIERLPDGQSRISPNLVEDGKLINRGSVSPLLSSSERDAYMVVEERLDSLSPKTTQKHLFTPADRQDDN